MVGGQCPGASDADGGLRCSDIPKGKHPAPASWSLCCWDLARLLYDHCTQGKLGFLSGLKINLAPWGKRR